MMSILGKLAGTQDRRDEEPNKELGRELVAIGNIAGIQEIAENLHNTDRHVQTDCLSVLEQVGLLDPALIENYVSDFIELVFSRENRLVWAAMINLALVADRKPGVIFEHYDDLVKVIEKGSVITKDNGIKTLARVASVAPEKGELILPYLFQQLRSCRPKSVAQYAESIFVAVKEEHKEQYQEILNERLPRLSPAQQRRVKKLLKTM